MASNNIDFNRWLNNISPEKNNDVGGGSILKKAEDKDGGVLLGEGLSQFDRDRLRSQTTGVSNACGRAYEPPRTPTGTEKGAVDRIEDLWAEIMEMTIKSPESKKMKSLAKDLQNARKILKKTIPQIKRLNDQLIDNIRKMA